MKQWPPHPVIYEINTWLWLGNLSRQYGMPIHLGTVPAAEWDALAAYGFDAVWFMGVWERSPAGIAISMHNAGLLADFKKALPDFAEEDNVGSPYCVRRYSVDSHLGGSDGLATARQELARRGLRLILDFVPNHVAPDHPWVGSHPDYFIQGGEADARDNPDAYIESGGSVYACGRDPFFPAWPDVLQLNAFDPGLRQAIIDTVTDIARQCDGIRCDMAMLMLNDVFGRTWQGRCGPLPDSDYWATIIPAVRQQHKDFLFIAEAYWDLEWALLQQGFNYCYDKKLYDRMEHGDVEGIRQHLCAEPAYQLGMIRFLENHDEPRAATTFDGDYGRLSALALVTLPGAKLLHDGQFEGRQVRLPVFLARQPEEHTDHESFHFYQQLLSKVSQDIFRFGQWRLCERSGWPDNRSFQNLLSWCWDLGEERILVIINLRGVASQAHVYLPWDGLRGETWRLEDLFSGEAYDRNGNDISDSGLYVDLNPWKYNLFRLSRLS